MGEKEGYVPFPDGFETMCIHHTATPTSNKAHCKETLVPIATSNMCTQENLEGLPAYTKGRIHNPTRRALEKLVAVINNGKYGLCYASGLGAITAVLGLLKCGDHIVSTDDLYGGTWRLLYELFPPLGITTTFADFRDMKTVEKAMTPKTKMIWTENPTNPKLKVIDICRTVEIAKSYGAIVTVDNSFLGPYFQRPLDYGADVVVQSAAKYVNGHSDAIMGCVCVRRDDLYKKLKYIQEHFGHGSAPFDCFQVMRGIRTLPLRMKRHRTSSLEVAKYLMNHPKIEEVIHPGHPSHPQHELFKSQACGHSGMVCFYLKGGIEESKKLIANLKVITHAVSLGGYESLIEIPARSSHKNLTDEFKKNLKMTDNYIRFSVGLEEVCDIIEDLDQALEKI